MKGWHIQAVPILLIILVFSHNWARVNGKSVKVRTKNNHFPTYPTYVKVAHPRHQPVVSSSPTKSTTYLEMLTRRNDTSEEQEKNVTDSPSTSTTPDPDNLIQDIFNAGFERLFKRLTKVLLANAPAERPAGENKEPNYKFPGLPSTPIFHSYDFSSLVKLLSATTQDENELELLAETAVVDTFTQISSIIGLNDLREWLGLVLMTFIVGPIAVPLVWLPVSSITTLALLGPLLFYNPPSKLNENEMGHDPIRPEENAEGRSFESLSRTDKSTLQNTTTMESCMERVACHVTRFYRNNPIFDWLSSQFHVTKVEWARGNSEEEAQGEFTSRENCSKYKCSIMLAPVVRRFMRFSNLHL